MSQSTDDSIGVPIPDEHVGAFVAEAFEDPERSTNWSDVVDLLVAPDARDAWEALDPREQVREALSMAFDYDRQAANHLDSVPLGSEDPAARDEIDEALRCRTNADTIRDGIADAYAGDRLGDEDLVAALEAADFEPGVVARREDLLEQVTNVYDVDYRPYGGTLFDADEGPEPETDHEEERTETW